MGYQIRVRSADGVVDRDPTLYTLAGPDGDEADVWPALGFNAVRWFAGGAERLYADPELYAGGRPTRSGVPVLFPFPNRIRDGRFHWAGRDYELPPNDPAMKNAIHGFACRAAWRVTAAGADDASAWVTGTYRASVDGGWTPQQWPADHELALTVRLGRGSLRLEAVVRNPDAVDLPFGFGYHPYFRATDETIVEVPAARYWTLKENLPTGEVVPVDASRDLNRPRSLAELKLDDVLTGLPGEWEGRVGDVRVRWSAGFREAVVFTPPHRQAFCVEPYTCTTDAVNVQRRGIDAGWLVLPPGGTWAGAVEFAVG